ncbi:hypothetical protein [Vreelandella boliviensis]|uniref:hypothetical protein n=1 Tax=Vreelandella boliviensis TaxID=223527 RepID=UPI001B8C42FC|nr:hypothetical protein [Halomonas boliviensis]MBS3667999.1 hypothetical protein [Halomonas boliviensis]
MTVNSMRLEKILRETEDVKRLGIPVKYMCLSLMCEYHKSLHGELFNIEEIKDLYSLENVPEDCRCGVTQVLVDEVGKPRNPRVVEKARLQSKDKIL